MAGWGGACRQHEWQGQEAQGEKAARLCGPHIGVSPTHVWKVWVHMQFQVVPPLSGPQFSSLYSEVSEWVDPNYLGI